MQKRLMITVIGLLTCLALVVYYERYVHKTREKGSVTSNYTNSRLANTPVVECKEDNEISAENTNVIGKIQKLEERVQMLHGMILDIMREKSTRLDAISDVNRYQYYVVNNLQRLMSALIRDLRNVEAGVQTIHDNYATELVDILEGISRLLPGATRGEVVPTTTLDVVYEALALFYRLKIKVMLTDSQYEENIWWDEISVKEHRLFIDTVEFVTYTFVHFYKQYNKNMDFCNLAKISYDMIYKLIQIRSESKKHSFLHLDITMRYMANDILTYNMKNTNELELVDNILFQIGGICTAFVDKLDEARSKHLDPECLQIDLYRYVNDLVAQNHLMLSYIQESLTIVSAHDNMDCFYTHIQSKIDDASELISSLHDELDMLTVVQSQ